MNTPNQTNAVTAMGNTPWKTFPETRSNRAGVIDSDCQTVAEIFGDGAETRKARARLIAAAPELFEVVKGLLELVGKKCKLTSNGELAPIDNPKNRLIARAETIIEEIEQ